MSEESKLLNPDIFNLDNNKSLLFYSEFIVINFKISKSNKVIEDISNGSITADDLEQNIQSKTAITAIKLTSIEGMYTDVKHDAVICFAIKRFGADNLIYKKIYFQNLAEKDKFITKIYSLIQNDFTYEKHKNTLMASLRIPFNRLMITLMLLGGFSFIAYLIETGQVTSMRIPIVIYPIILLLEHTGYLPIVALTAVVSLFFIGWMIKNMIVPTERLIINRKN